MHRWETLRARNQGEVTQTMGDNGARTGRESRDAGKSAAAANSKGNSQQQQQGQKGKNR